MKTLPAEKIREVVSLKLSGLSDREAARQSGVSHTGVASSFRGFVGKAEEVGLMRASEEYGVADQVRQLQEIAQLQRRTGLTYDQAKKGFIWGKMLISSDLPEEQIEDYSQKVLKECEAQKVSPSTIVSVCRRMSMTRQRTGKGYEEIERDVASLSLSKTKLEMEVSSLEGRVKEVRSNHKEVLDQAGVEEKAIAQFVDVKARLESRGCHVEDMGKLDALLGNAEKLNYDVEKMVSAYELNGDLAKDNAVLKKDNEGFVKKNTQLKDDNFALDGERNEKVEMLSKVEDAEQAGLTVDSISKVAYTIVRISAKHGVSKSEAVDVFAKDIEERYDEELGLVTSITRLKAAELKQLERNRELTEKKRIQEEHYLNRKEEINAANWLNRNGVTGKEIVEFRREFQETRKGLPELENEFYTLTNIPLTLKKYDDRFKLLDKEELERKAQNEQLAKERLSLEAANKALEESYSSRVKVIENTVVKSMQDSVSHIIYVSGEVGGKAEKAIDDSVSKIEKRMNEAEKTLSQSDASLKLTVDKAKKDVESISGKVFSAGEAMGAYNMISVLHRILRGEDVDKVTGGTSLLTTLKGIEPYLNSHGAVYSIQSTRNLQESIKNEFIYH